MHDGHEMDRRLLLDAGAVGALLGYFRGIKFGDEAHRAAALAIVSLAAEAPEISAEELIEGGFNNGPVYWALYGLRQMQRNAPDDDRLVAEANACMEVGVGIWSFVGGGGVVLADGGGQGSWRIASSGYMHAAFCQGGGGGGRGGGS